MDRHSAKQGSGVQADLQIDDEGNSKLPPLAGQDPNRSAGIESHRLAGRQIRISCGRWESRPGVYLRLLTCHDTPVAGAICVNFDVRKAGQERHLGFGRQKYRANFAV